MARIVMAVYSYVAIPFEEFVDSAYHTSVRHYNYGLYSYALYRYGPWCSGLYYIVMAYIVVAGSPSRSPLNIPHARAWPATRPVHLYRYALYGYDLYRPELHSMALYSHGTI